MSTHRRNPQVGARALYAAVTLTFVEVINYVFNRHFVANGPVVLGALSVIAFFILAFWGLGIDSSHRLYRDQPTVLDRWLTRLFRWNDNRLIRRRRHRQDRELEKRYAKKNFLEYVDSLAPR